MMQTKKVLKMQSSLVPRYFRWNFCYHLFLSLQFQEIVYQAFLIFFLFVLTIVWDFDTLKIAKSGHTYHYLKVDAENVLIVYFVVYCLCFLGEKDSNYLHNCSVQPTNIKVKVWFSFHFKKKYWYKETKWWR